MIIASQISRQILHDLNATSTLLLIFATCLLLFKPNRGRAQTALAVVLAFWSIPYITGTCAAFFNFHIAPMGGVLPVPYMVGGTFYMILLLLLPYDIVRPGWVTLRRTLLIMLPYAIIDGTYYAATAALGQKVETITTYAELWARRGEFCVWYRAVILLTIAGYLICGCRFIGRELPNYVKRCNEEFGAGADSGLSWIRIYSIWGLTIIVSYCSVIFIGHAWNEVVNTAVLQAFFVFVFFKSWNYANPYSEFDMNKNAHTTHITPQVASGGDTMAPHGPGVTSPATDEEQQFDDKIGEYSRQVREWFNSTRPYLNPEFKLLDVMEILPLNRTYLSRVFNEGFGENFSAVVRGYRLRHAEELLTKCPEMRIVDVARESGFSSSSVFHRVFQTYKGVTPVQFRKNSRTE